METASISVIEINSVIPRFKKYLNFSNQANDSKTENDNKQVCEYSKDFK